MRNVRDVESARGRHLDRCDGSARLLDDARRELRKGPLFGLAGGGSYNRGVDSDALTNIALRHGLSLVVRFGSTATGRTHGGSDIDVGVLFERFPAALDAELAVIADLQSLGDGVPVDVTVLNRADPLLMKQVSEHGVLEYGSASHFDAFRRYAFKRYQDHRRFLDMEREYVKRAVRAERG